MNPAIPRGDGAVPLNLQLASLGRRLFKWFWGTRLSGVCVVLLLLAAWEASVRLDIVRGTISLDPIYHQVARTFGVSRTRVFLRVIFRTVLPFIMAGLRTALGLALIVTVVSEMITGSGGVGYYLLQMQYALQPANMYAAIILLAAVAYLLNQIFVMWEAHIIHWARTREASWTA